MALNPAHVYHTFTPLAKGFNLRIWSPTAKRQRAGDGVSSTGNAAAAVNATAANATQTIAAASGIPAESNEKEPPSRAKKTKPLSELREHKPLSE